MIDQVDNLLRTVLVKGVPELAADGQISFQPPDETWRTAVVGLNANALNVYLVDLRERRELRSNEWHYGSGSRDPEPARVDCHYLVSAWSPAQITPHIEPTLDEHRFLYDAMGVLLRASPLVPKDIYPENTYNALPAVLKNEIPTEVVPPEGFMKLPEFWGAMGSGTRWKPAIWLIVTVPVALTTVLTDPLVTTRIIEFRQGDNPDTAEVLVQIAGTVRHGSDPVGSANVRIERGTAVLDTYVTGPDGRFTFGELRPSTHKITVVAAGYNPHSVDITVPDPNGSYDIAIP